MKLLTPILVVILLVGGMAALVRHNFIVIDGAVTWWQVEPVLARGTIKNDREYRAVLYYVEQIFSSGGFDRPRERALADRLNVLLANYHLANGQAPRPPDDGA